MIPMPLFQQLVKKAAKNISYDSAVPDLIKVRTPKKGYHHGSEFASYHSARKNTGISRWQLSRLRREFARFDKGKKNAYEKTCGKIAQSVAGHYRLQPTPLQSALAELDIEQSSQQFLREANLHAGRRWKNYLFGSIGAAVGALIGWGVAVLFENDPTQTKILVGLVAGLGAFCGVQTNSDDPSSDLKKQLVQAAYNARAAVFDHL